jgi:hypothetical protein
MVHHPGETAHAPSSLTRPIPRFSQGQKRQQRKQNHQQGEAEVRPCSPNDGAQIDYQPYVLE